MKHSDLVPEQEITSNPSTTAERCIHCGSTNIWRVHRHWYERLVARRVFHCRRCAKRMLEFRISDSHHLAPSPAMLDDREYWQRKLWEIRSELRDDPALAPDIRRMLERIAIRIEERLELTEPATSGNDLFRSVS